MGFLICLAWTNLAFSAQSLNNSDRLIIRILRHQLPPYREVQDGLAELLDLVGASGEGGEGVEGEAGVGAEGLGVGVGRGQAGEAGGGQSVAGGLAHGAGRLQPVQQRHQLIDLRDDAVLFGEGRRGGISERCPASERFF